MIFCNSKVLFFRKRMLGSQLPGLIYVQNYGNHPLANTYFHVSFRVTFNTEHFKRQIHLLQAYSNHSQGFHFPCERVNENCH